MFILLASSIQSLCTAERYANESICTAYSSVLFTFLYKFDVLAYQRCFYCVNTQKQSLSGVKGMQEKVLQ